ncbi:oxidoreductase [Coniochaeta sp. 2T2.1]|nr:oxidoreductase [Coniochaeta sp. 2T2.1]
MPNTKRLQAILNKDPKYAPFLPYVSGPPRPVRELSWLKSFLVCVGWMEKAFSPLASASKSLVECNPRLHIRDLGNDALFPPPDYGKFVAEAPAELIASCILRDSKLCDEDGLEGKGPEPSSLGLYLPEFTTSRGREIARYLVASTDLGMDIRQLTYDSLKGKLVRHQEKVGVIKSHDDGYKLAFEVPMDGSTSTGKEAAPTDAPAPTEPPATQDPVVTETEVDIAARVLRNLLGSSLPPGATAADALKVLSNLNLSTDDNHPMEIDEPATSDPKSWDDTVRHFYIHVPHKTHPSMCIPCGNFNQAGSDLSMPGNLNLFGKTALVTGARVNLGYHVALRLLRCGAKVIASTRYPRDAVSRYEAEPDSDRWVENLRVVGADFRSARDAFELVRQTQTIIAAWGGRLDILINNAAQTLTDSIKTEGQAVHRENLLKDKVSTTPLLEQQYSPRVRGGAQSLIEGPAADFSKDLSPAGTSGTATDIGPVSEKSSWVLSLPEIPYEDIISAHSVNTFVPLILIRELLPLMGLPQSAPSSSPTASDTSPSTEKSPLGYIVNVSSREGIFESRPQHAHKAGHHVHTNMSKAALNMITETEAGPAWTTRRVAMNTVDPGYMSAAPEMEDLFDGTRPIGWEDGAGRVLWPVAVGEGGGEKGKQGQAVWGRFLKHYGAVRVETGWGRG